MGCWAREMQARVARAGLGVAQEHRAGAEAAAVAMLLDEAVALERREQARGGALREVRPLGQLGDRLGPLALQHADEQLRGAVHRLRSRRLPLKLLFHER